MSIEFNANSTAEDVLSGRKLKGLRALVTGVSSGLGLETARALAAHGAKVVGVVRDLSRADQTAREVPGLELVAADLACQASVRACVADLCVKGDSFDLIIANAGVMAVPFGRTFEGFELHLATNHLGHFALVTGLSPLLTSGSRVVVLTSGGHRASDIDLEDLNFDHTAYQPMLAYGRSKTANILFAVAFNRRFRERGVRATAVHPGTIDTNLGRYMTDEVKQRMIDSINASRPAGALAFRYKSVGQGAATSVWAGIVASGDAVGGNYCEDCHVAEVVDTPGARIGVRSYALDEDRADALWALSERLVASAT